MQAEVRDAAAAANIAASQALLDKSVIRAPITGIVVSRALNPGDIATPSSVLVTIVDPASIVLSARFDESGSPDFNRDNPRPSNCSAAMVRRFIAARCGAFRAKLIRKHGSSRSMSLLCASRPTGRWANVVLP